MNVFGHPFPRVRATRQKRIAGVPGKRRAEWDPFTAADEAYYELVDHRALAMATDAYAERLLD